MEKVAVAIARRFAGSLLILASLATFAIAYDQGGGQSFWHDIGIALFCLWAISPYAGIALLLVLARNRPIALWVVFIGALLAVTFGLWELYKAFYVYPDAQGGLVFVFMPLYQWAGVGGLACMVVPPLIRQLGKTWRDRV